MDGKSITVDDVAPMIAEQVKAAVDAIPKPKDGVDGKDGADAPPVVIDMADVVRELLAADGIKQYVGLEVADYLAKNPPAAGKDGVDGRDGAAGEQGPQGEKGEPGADGAGIADLMIDRDNNLIATFTDGRMKSLGCVVGKDGLPGKDGRSVENFTRRYEPEAHEIVERWTTPDGEHELRYPAGGIHHKGYWSERVKAKAGESWTHNGTLWIACEDTADEPSATNKAWTIGARKGRDGRDGKDGRAPPAPVKLKGKKDDGA